MKKTYLGGSVYAQIDGDMILLTTENGYLDDPRNKIWLELEVYKALALFIERAEEARTEKRIRDSNRSNGI